MSPDPSMSMTSVSGCFGHGPVVPGLPQNRLYAQDPGVSIVDFIVARSGTSVLAKLTGIQRPSAYVFDSLVLHFSAFPPVKNAFFISVIIKLNSGWSEVSSSALTGSME